MISSTPRSAIHGGEAPTPYRYIPKPKVLSDIPRRYRRYGKPREEFQDYLKKEPFDAVLIQTVMTYWYPGVREVIEDIRRFQPAAKIVLGGVYATLCPEHARSLGADLVIEGCDLDPLWDILSIEPVTGVPFLPPVQQKYGIMKLTEGCPFRCSYCASSILRPEFTVRPTGECLAELEQWIQAGIQNIAFYDDALLFHPEQGLEPFLEEVVRRKVSIFFHTPNALNARFITENLAQLMVSAGFASFFIGLESRSDSWHRSTGGKVSTTDFVAAAGHLRSAGARSITTYIIVGHPDSDGQSLEQSMAFAHENGTRVVLSEFSPIPGTEDGMKSTEWADLEEPLSHNKTAFAIRRLGTSRVNSLKELNRSLNSKLK